MEKRQISAPDLGRLARMLRKVEFFTPLTVKQLERVLSGIMLYSYENGETVFRQGQAGDAFYIVHEGSVEIRLRRWRVLTKTVATLKPGDFMGEIALISGEPRNATAVCVEPTLLFTLITDDFRFVLYENPAAAEEMRNIAARRAFASSHQV